MDFSHNVNVHRTNLNLLCRVCGKRAHRKKDIRFRLCSSVSEELEKCHGIRVATVIDLQHRLLFLCLYFIAVFFSIRLIMFIF